MTANTYEDMAAHLRFRFRQFGVRSMSVRVVRSASGSTIDVRPRAGCRPSVDDLAHVHQIAQANRLRWADTDTAVDVGRGFSSTGDAFVFDATDES